MSDYVVGLTGGIGSGKSTVADCFVALGIPLIDTDAIAHELTGPNGAAMPAVVAAFGPGIVDQRGALDRAAMRRLVFADPAARRGLEAILHPLIRQISAERCQAATAPYVILAVPLLVESGTYRERCDRILVIDCAESTQIRRVQARNGLSEEEVRRILASQASRSERLAIADDVIINENEIGDLAPIVGQLSAKYLSLSAKKAHAKC